MFLICISRRTIHWKQSKLFLESHEISVLGERIKNSASFSPPLVHVRLVRNVSKMLIKQTLFFGPVETSVSRTENEWQISMRPLLCT